MEEKMTQGIRKKRVSFIVILAALVLIITGCRDQADTAPDSTESMGAESAGITEAPEIDAPERDVNDAVASSAAEEPNPEPMVWDVDAPENHGMDSAVFDSLHTALQGTQVNAAVTVKDGVIVDEFYQDDYDENSVFRFNSCSKSFTSALIGIAIDEGLIAGVDVPISEYFPQVIGTTKEGITIRHLLEHTSGIEWYEFGGSAESFWGMNNADNWVDYVLERPMDAEPGATFAYSTGGTHLLAAILEQATAESLFDYAKKHIFDPLGMDSVRWRADPQEILDGGNGIEMTARDAAKFGQLFLDGGASNGRQLVPEAWVKTSTSVQVARSGNYGSYGYQWWIRPFGAAGYDTYYAMGAMGQFIVVVPELDLVTVITSSMSGQTDGPYVYISDYILAAYTGDASDT
jgi:CubicO group peptidase (beta-lactamase class C family)